MCQQNKIKVKVENRIVLLFLNKPAQVQENA